MPVATLDLHWSDLNPSTPISGARLQLMTDAINEALTISDEALAARLADPMSAAYQAVAAVAASKPKGDRWANVQTYLDPGRVEGVTDDRPAFEAARLTGLPVYCPTGDYYLSRSPDWGDNVVFTGDGKGRTVIHLLDSAAASADLFSNASLTGTTQGYFADFTLDGNCMRQGGVNNVGGSRGSCMVFRNVKNFYVDRVSAINGVLHGFDVTRGHLDYPYLPDGQSATLRSDGVQFTQCDASNFGDDAFTSHSSDNIDWTRCVGFNPRKRGNNNAFEVDGDSKRVTLTGNLSLGCYAGVEIKGHSNESAGQEVIINGHRDIGSVRSYNWRHIGFHDPADPTSLSAFNILATNLVSINPNNAKGFQDEATPRALVISAFRGVSVHGLTAVGAGGYAAGDVAVSVQFKASGVTLSGLNISGWTGAGSDISITTADLVNVSGVSVRNSAARAFYVGTTATSVKLWGLQATAPATGSTHGVGIANSSAVDMLGVTCTGYVEGPIKADGLSFASLEAYLARDRSPVAGATSILAGCPTPGKTYYIPDPLWGTMTDRPNGSAGAPALYEVKNGDLAGTTAGHFTQTARRITTTSALDRYERFVTTTGVAGAWYKIALTLA